MAYPKGPYRLLTVNTAPERATKLVGRFIENVRDRYVIDHAQNCERIEEVKPALEKLKPDLLFCASMWTKEESDYIQNLAKEIVPGIKTHAIPQGLQVEKGPDAVVEYLTENVPKLLES